MKDKILVGKLIDEFSYLVSTIMIFYTLRSLPSTHSLEFPFSFFHFSIYDLFAVVPDLRSAILGAISSVCLIYTHSRNDYYDALTEMFPKP